MLPSLCSTYKNISEEQRDQIMELIALAGVSVNVHFIPMPMLTLFKNLGYSIRNYPVAYDNYSRKYHYQYILN